MTTNTLNCTQSLLLTNAVHILRNTPNCSQLPENNSRLSGHLCQDYDGKMQVNAVDDTSVNTVLIDFKKHEDQVLQYLELLSFHGYQLNQVGMEPLKIFPLPLLADQDIVINSAEWYTHPIQLPIEFICYTMLFPSHDEA